MVSCKHTKVEVKFNGNLLISNVLPGASSTDTYTWYQLAWSWARRWRTDNDWDSALSSTKCHPIQENEAKCCISQLGHFVLNQHDIEPTWAPWFCSIHHTKSLQYHSRTSFPSYEWTHPRCSVLSHLCPRLLLSDRLNRPLPTKILTN